MRDGTSTILVVEDDPKLASALQEYFTGNGYHVLHAGDGEEALDIFFSNNQKIDIVLLDVMLPKLDGYDVLRTIRNYSSVPIIMTTSKEAEEEQLEGLNSGADNYITKPYRLSILRAHVEVLLNRNANKEQMLRAGAVKIDLLAQKVYVGEKEIVVTPKEFSLLKYFVQNRKVVLSRDVILDAVWGYDYDGDFRTVDTLVKQLRKKLAGEYNYIHSIYGVGYYFEESAVEKNV